MLGNCSTWQVAQVFFDQPTQLQRLREISRKADLAHTSVKQHLERLLEHNIIERETETQGSRDYPLYIANMEANTYKTYKFIDILHRIEQTRLVTKLEERTTPDCVVLFGSAERGEDTEASDIDLYVQAEERDIALERYEEQLHRTIQLHFKANLNQYPRELQQNIRNGKTLYGYLR